MDAAGDGSGVPDASLADGGGTDGAGQQDATTDGAGLADGSGDGTVGPTTDGATTDARHDSGDGGGAPDDGFMEGSGCACSVPSGGSSGVMGWALLALGVAVRVVRRKRK